MQFSSVSQIKQTTQRGFGASLLIAALVLGTSGVAQASLLNLTPGSPDISSNFINVSYDAGTESLVADGFATELDGGVPGIAGGSFNLSAMIDASGNLGGGGTITIGGTLAGLGHTSGTLLTGTLTDIGFASEASESGSTLEFLFNVTGGDLQSVYGGTGGVILSTTGFNKTNSWSIDFANGAFAGLSDTFGVSPVPVPAAVWLFGSALIGLAGFGRHSRRKQGLNLA